MMEGISKRQLQIASVMQKALVEIFYKLGLKNITISEVKLSSDIKYATIFCCSWQSLSIDHLQQMLPVIKAKLSQAARLRSMPEIRFKIDTSFDEFSKISDLLNHCKS